MPNIDDYAILVGIDKYKFLPRLNGAREDATKFALWLQDPDGGGLLPDKIELILSPESSQSPEPVQKQIDDALEKFKINHKRRIGRRLYFYFSGHGYGQFDDIGMLMASASENTLNENIGLRPYKIFLTRWGFFDEIVFILDCCRGSADHALTREPKFTLDPNLIPKPPPKVESFTVLATNNGRLAFSALNPEAGQKRGILTQAVLEGLKEQFATDEKGRITASSLNNYVRRRVIQIAQSHGIEQSAEIIAPTIGEITFNEGLTKMQEIGIKIPKGINELTIKNAKLKPIAKYTLDATSGNWNFNYLTHDEQLKKFVHPITIAPANDSTFKVNLVQNGWYAFEVPNGDYTLDLREVDSNDTNYIFKFE